MAAKRPHLLSRAGVAAYFIFALGRCRDRFVTLTCCHEIFNHLEIFSLLVAVVAHDVSHPGLNNNFLVTTKHELAILHNDRSPLENMHCATLYDVLKNDVRCPCFPCHGPRLTIAPLLVLRTCPSHRTSTSSRS